MQNLRFHGTNNGQADGGGEHASKMVEKKQVVCRFARDIERTQAYAENWRKMREGSAAFRPLQCCLA